MRPIPNMTILVPCDAIEARKATVAAAAWKGPVYLRFARDKTPIVTTDQTPFTIGKAELFAHGNDVVIIAMGTLVYEALMAGQLLLKEGISAAVINCHTVKPLDETMIIALARSCGCVVTCEEHQIIGGLGGAVSEVLSEKYPVPVVKVGVQNKFGQSGTPDELMKLYGLKAVNVVEAAKQAIKLKYAHTVHLSDKVPRAPKGAEIKRASKMLRQAPQEMAFYTKSGSMIRSLPELHKAVRSMDQGTFSHHVNSSRNDFATWVADVHQDHELAAALKKSLTREAVSQLIGHRIGQLMKVKE